MDNLPCEIIVHIFSFVDTFNQRKLMMASKDYNLIIDDMFSKDVIPFVSMDEFLDQIDPKITVYSISYLFSRYDPTLWWMYARFQ